MFIIRRGAVLLLLYLATAVGVLVVIDTPFNEGFGQSITWLSAPILIISLVFVRRNLEDIQLITGYSAGKVWRNTVLVASALVFMSWPHVLLVNAVFGKSVPTILSGKVIEKFRSGRSATLGVIALKDEGTGAVVQLSVPEHVYAKLHIGNTYSDCFFVGPLGLAYRWRKSEDGSRCSEGAGAA